MRAVGTKVLIALALLPCCWSNAHAWGGVRVGIGIGIPFPCYGYGYGPYYGYGGYYGYYAPPVVVAAPSPTVVVQQPPVAASTISASPNLPAVPAPAPAPPTLPAPTPVSSAPSYQGNQAPALLSPVADRGGAAIDSGRSFQHLNDPNESVRMNAVMQLGRDKILQAVSPLSQILASDSSPRVREAAARALGLIGSISSLNALQTAAQADDDREVRQSARFAAEVIRGNLPR